VILVDTGAWYALVERGDSNSAAARSWFRANRELLVTTDQVINELLTLLRARGKSRRAVTTGRRLLAGQAAKIEWVGEQDFRAAFEVFERFLDKEWSFTDCTSYAVIERLGLKKAFSFDRHFRQFGVVEVVP
jgi:predicted nucleic acid-binding protein